MKSALLWLCLLACAYVTEDERGLPNGMVKEAHK